MLHKRNVVAGVTLALAAVVTQVNAASQDDRWYIAPLLSYVDADSDRIADNDLGLQLGVGKPVSAAWNLELAVVADTLDFKSGGGEFKQRGLLLDGLYLFNRSMNFSPYGVVGVGMLRTTLANDDANNAMLNVGVGVMHSLTDSGIALRGDVRYRLDDDDRVAGVNRFGDWLVNIGLVVPFGGKSVAVAEAAALEPVEADSDGDGVVDSRDSCPGTPAGAHIDAKGCELDSDSDGVVDSRDSCPDTKAGARVDSKGCELAEVIILKGVNFETGSANLTSDSQGVLDDMAATLMKYPTMVVEVSGHTDNTGSADLNRQLSQQRADAVVSYLVAKGVKADNLKSEGFGPDKPVADNATDEGRAANRRVEMHILQR